MERLDRTRNVTGYLCGRLLAILEEAQRRAATGTLNTTLVDRFYGATSSAPAAYFPALVRLAETAHLPKVRREQRGYAKLEALLQDVAKRLDETRGFPPTLTLPEQAEFVLGFYHQRADFAANRPGGAATPTGTAQGGTTP